jgi:DNA primase
VVGDFVGLKRKGGYYLGLCPFHNEKTPSFTVTPAKGIYKCFGCGASGDSVKFVMEHESMTYPEALRYLAARYNIEIEETKLDPEIAKAETIKESLYIINNFAKEYFIDYLQNNPSGKAIGLTYLAERGFSDTIIQKFDIGFCPEDGSLFSNEAVKKTYNNYLLIALGLTRERDNGGLYDYFRGRIMFPIHNLSGRVAGFGGRILKKSDKAPKYLNSPESEIYYKSKILYGIFQSKKSIVEKDECFLVEGYTDVVSLHQAGVENVVASSGTALTKEQIKLIKRYTNNITILYDGDAAGIKAALRGIDLILEEGMNVKVLLFPDGEDPDSYSRKVSYTELQEFISTQKKDFIRYITSLLYEDAKGDPIRVSNIIKDIVGSIALIPEPIVRAMYIKECSSLMKISEEALLSELNKVRRNNLKDKIRRQENAEAGIKEDDFITPDKAPKQGVSFQKTIENLEEELVKFLINYGVNDFHIIQVNEAGEEITVTVKVADYLINELVSDGVTFENPVYAGVYHEIVKLNELNELDKLDSHFKYNEDLSLKDLYIDLISERYTISENWEKKHNIFVESIESRIFHSMEKVLYAFRVKKLELMRSELSEKLKNVQQDEDFELILTEMKMIDDLKKKISDKLGRVILA